MRRRFNRFFYFAIFITIGICSFYLFSLTITPNHNNIILATIHKSGSTYTAAKLAKSLDYEIVITGNSPWLDTKYFKNLNNSHPVILKTHSKATNSNLQKLKKYAGNKIVVHVRDPRAAVLSEVYHHTTKPEEEKWYNTNPALATEKEYGDVRFLQKYLSLSLDERKDFMINEWFMSNVRWIQEWCALKEREDKKPDGLKIIITSYDELLADEDKFFQRVYQHFSIDQKMIKDVEVAKDKSVRFRSGNPNEWRTAFSAAQIARMNKDMPQWLLDRFGWQP